MVLIAGFSRHMEHITRVSHVTPNPLRDILSKTTADTRVIPLLVCRTQISEARFGPFAHRHHYGFLIHCKLLLFVKLQ